MTALSGVTLEVLREVMQVPGPGNEMATSFKPVYVSLFGIMIYSTFLGIQEMHARL